MATKRPGSISILWNVRSERPAARVARQIFLVQVASRRKLQRLSKGANGPNVGGNFTFGAHQLVTKVGGTGLDRMGNALPE